MAKKNKTKKSIHADSIDVVSEKYENEKAETKKHKNVQDLNIETIASDTPFYLKHRIPIFSSIYKIKSKFFLEDKKKFFLYLSLIIFALLVSITLIVVGGLWLSGTFGENPANSEIGFIPGLIMAIGASILVVV